MAYNGKLGHIKLRTGLPVFYLLFICTCGSKAVGYNLDKGVARYSAPHRSNFIYK